MKYQNYFLTGILFIMSSVAFAQVQKSKTLQVGNTSTTTINPSAALQVDDTARGFLGARMTTAQRTAIVSPATGLQVYDTDTNSNWTYNGTSWSNSASSSDIWAKTGNSGTNSTTNYIGTNDAVDFVTRTNGIERMRIKATGNVGIGTLIPNGKLTVSDSLSSVRTAALLVSKFGNSNISSDNFSGLGVGANVVTGDITDYYGATNTLGVYHSGSGLMGSAVGVLSNVNAFSDGSITNGYGFRTKVQPFGNGSIRNAYGFVIDNVSATGSDPSNPHNAYGIFLPNAITASGGSTNKAWSIYSASTAASYYAGRVGIGNTAPDYELDVNGQIKGNRFIGFGQGNVQSNSAVGLNALPLNTTGANNTADGVNALSKNTTGANNTAIGNAALISNTTGSDLVSIGYWTLPANTTGNANIGIGNYSLNANTTGFNNTGIGMQSLAAVTTASNNTAIGRSALSNTIGGYNVGIGFGSGQSISDGTAATNVANSVFIGSDARALANNQTNQIVIGISAVGIGSNSVVLGNDAITTTALKGNIGIGTTSPSAKLHVAGTALVSTMATGTATDDIVTVTSGGLLNKRTLASVLGSSVSSANNGITATSGTVSLGGPLTGLTTISGLTATNKMAFTGTGVDNFNVDAGTFSVDATNNRIGINTTAPTAQLHVVGNALISTMATGTATDDIVTVTSSGLLNKRTLASILGSSVSSANNGITATSGTVSLGGALTGLTTISGLTATNKMAFTGTGVDNFNVDAGTFSVDATNNRIGINTTTPTAQLHVVGNALISTMATGTATDDIVTVTATGLLNKRTLASVITANNGITATSGTVSLGGALTGLTTISGLTATNKMAFTGTGVDNFNVDAGTLSVDAANNRVGINTIAPTERLEVAGNIKTDRILAYGTGGVTTNVAIGLSSLNVNTTGANNVAIGSNSLLRNATSSGNIAIGSNTLSNVLSAGSNIAIGVNSLVSTTASYGIAIGEAALQNNTSGDKNIAFGYASNGNNTTGSLNLAIGYVALRNNITGTGNLAIGYAAGTVDNSSVSNTNGSASLFLGNSTKPLATGQTNQIVIGDSAVGIGSNTVVLGNSSIVTTALRGNVGIGTTTPTVRLDVAGAIKVGNDTTTTPTAGMIRFNTTTYNFEGYTGTSWIIF